MSDERHQECNGDEDQFTTDEADQFPALRSAKLTAANATLDDIYEIIDKVPFWP